MADVAERAGVSRALVSIVFRNAPGASADNRARVLRAAEELSYRMDGHARLLRSARTRSIGVVFDLRHEFHAQLVDELYQAAEATGYELVLGAVTASRPEHRAVQSLIDYRCEALILVGSALPVAELDELAAGIPVVTMARALRSDAVDTIRTDDVAGARRAVQHLLSLGHREIAHIDGHRAPGAAERRRGYRAAMRAAGCAVETRIVRGGLTEVDGQRAAAELLFGGGTRPTAVFAFNDHCAAGVQASARAQRYDLPDELSLIGYDDSPIARLATVDLTTIGQDTPQLAGLAVSRAIEWAERTVEHAADFVVAPSLVLRSSCRQLVTAAAVG